MSYWNRKTLAHENQGLMQSVVENWLSEKPKRTVFGNFRIEDNQLVFRSQTTAGVKVTKAILERIKKGESKLIDKDDLERAKKFAKDSEGLHLRVSETVENLISVRLKNGTVLGNSSILPLVGRTMAYGNETLNRSETLIQRYLTNKAIMIPFSVFEAAKLDIESFEMIEKGPEETISRKKRNPSFKNWEKNSTKNPEFDGTENVHFTGASLFKVGPKHFLFDLDRVEIKNGIFNPFLSEIPKAVKTIAEAYTALKPKAVIDAEKKGLKVIRQGEWFFIPSKAPKLAKVTLNQEETLKVLLDRFGARDVPSIRKKVELLPKPTRLRAGNNRPNDVELGITQKGVTYVMGQVTHSGREHAPVELKTWHIVIPNTAIGSFQITGDVD